MARTQLMGGAYEARSYIASAQRCLNLFCEPMPHGNPNSPTTGQGEPAPYAYYPTPGLRPLCSLAQGPVRGIWSSTDGRVYAVGADTVYRVGADWSVTAIGSLPPGRTTPVSMADNGLDVLLVDGSPWGWTIRLADDAFARLDSSGGAFRGGTRVDYLDTFFILNAPGTPQFYASNSLSTVFDPLYFANKEAFSDMLVVAAVAKLEIWLVGTKSTEIYFNSGKADFPFERQPSVFIDHGTCAPYSVVSVDNNVLWLSQDREGRGIVVRGAGYTASRISTYAIEDDLSRYRNLTDAIGVAYQVAGHWFYSLSFPTDDRTWCYDIGVGQWHELATLDSNGTEHRHRANCSAVAHGQVVVGDYVTGEIHALDPDCYTDAGMPIKRQRAFPHIMADGKRVAFHCLQADMQAGRD